MKINKFEDIIAWQKAKKLTVEIYKSFGDCRDFGFKDQIQRASVSIMNNIAEGFERLGDKELKKFLFIAKGSCAEVRSMLYLAFDLNYLSKEKTRQYYDLSLEISKMISGLIKTLNY
ncbi:four helix bundle protein [Candidatus Uhrbacteria bacterium RIFCSPHIGHO2_12_FULL_47_11]|uniref:Four helix bundle protein n=1 Tax=Candidatus Magasanikbacteria bacterium RIFCSPLOWO2_12_FULL_43_12 TaxID=1798692 RepID=A0A1F6MVY4_9BACT|nr:MAG: four helix bundle protein [Candidatus Magasanikbacteria bacterium RIFCSPLOWO2_02_FULL_43_22]OGH75583.1 MAG: four helix bundle protein [Candidatus Magasanikbacteria bacterium RIFCSPLOWO2_12_FULL_43_12]OGL76270.1 MAG: four helix bundle protein [Candidatus Uhrbacteria bacterium RIFCSPHIGHO2_12_FULL_47_11]